MTPSDTVTTADLLAEPPAPMQVRVNVLLLAVSAAEFSVPAVGRLPTHAPEAAQLVALVVDQVSVDVSPLMTLNGFATRLTVGAGVPAATVTVTDCCVVPPAPVQLKLNILLAAVSAPLLTVPEVARLPDHAPLAVQPVAPVEDQVSAELPPLATLVGFAPNVTVGATGAATETVADALPDPPAPSQVSVNTLLAAVSGPELADPEVPLGPLQAPEAVQVVASELVQVSVELSPVTIESGLADRVTLAGCATDSCDPPPAQALAASAINRSAQRHSVVMEVCI